MSMSHMSIQTIIFSIYDLCTGYYLKINHRLKSNISAILISGPKKNKKSFTFKIKFDGSFGEL